VLVVDHDAQGSFGFVINKLAGVELDQLIDQMDISRSIHTSAPVLMGGPVSPQSGWIVYDRADALAAEGDEDGSLVIGDRLAFTASMGVLEQMAHGHGPSRGVMLLGYSGWSAGQLEREMAEGSWIPAELDLDLIFATPVAERWSAAMAAMGIDPGRMMGGVMSA
jgi:putative transcriptional regulator